MKKKKILRTLITLAVIMIAVVGIAAVLTSNKEKNQEKTAIVSRQSSSVSVRTSLVTKEVLDLGFSANGTFIPAAQMDFAAENSGRITRVLVDEGSVVRKGQVLAVIEMNQLNVDLENAEAVYQNALREQQRYENAFRTGGVTQQQVDQAVLTLNNAKAKLEQARIRLGDASVRASIDGIVNKRYVEPGAVVSPGTKLFELVDVSSLKLQISVTEGQVANLKPGDTVRIKASVFPDRDFKGKVTFIAPKADNALNFPVEITVSKNPGNLLKAGMYATAIFRFPTTAPVILVPRTAFVGSVNSNEIFVVNTGDSTASIRKVVAGRTTGDKVQVLEGLLEGEMIVTSGQVNLSEGSKVSAIAR